MGLGDRFDKYVFVWRYLFFIGMIERVFMDYNELMVRQLDVKVSKCVM